MTAAASTRRGFLAGAVASAAVPALARGQAPAAPPPGLIPARRQIVRRGRAIAAGTSGRRLVVAHDRRRTVALLTPSRNRSRLVDVGGQPLEVAVSPDSRLAAVTTAFWDEPGLVIVDLLKGAVRTRVDVGPAPFGVMFTPDNRRLVVSGGEQEGTVHVLDTRRFAVKAREPIGTVPRALAPAPDGRTAWVALNGMARVARVDLRTGRTTRTLHTAALPDRIAVSPDGRRLLVSHGGPDAEYVSEIVIASGRVRRHRTGHLPSAVAWTARGRRLVLLSGTGELVVLGRRGARGRRRVGGVPRGLAVAGERVWTVDAVTGAVRGLRP
ncbi:MAG: SMP-30/Gluconolaconase/LRE-like region-containing protein [Solirubrobacterales bacterium]|nr:SMP-30/Gluconolaconase/LRE-like region-containing protein [Solirubrobacterales bacterium]